MSVASDKVDAARLQVAAAGAPKSGRMGFELFDKPNWMGSDFDDRINYQRALEGELERTLQTLEGVESVRVHLVLAKESLYGDKSEPAKASVVLHAQRGSLASTAQVAVRRLVAGAVEGLRPENVAVIDTAGKDTGNGGAEGVADPANGRDRLLTKQLIETLEPVIGADSVRANVHVEYDEASGEETQETYDPATPVTLTSQKSEETAGGPMAQGVPGTASNIPNTSTPAKPSTSSDYQSSRSESSTYAVSKLFRHTLVPPGRVKRITAALVIDDEIVTDGKGARTRVKRSPEDLKKIETVVRAALGITESRGDVVAVENLPFRDPPKEEPPAPASKLERVMRGSRQWAWLSRYAILATLFVAVYLMVLRPVRRQLLSVFHEVALAPGGSGALGAPSGNVLDGGTLHPSTMPQPASLKQQLAERAKAEPGSASQLVQSWLREEEA